MFILAALATIYAALFVLLAPPEKQDGTALYASFGLAVSLLILSYIDLRTGLLLDVITLPLISVGIAFAWFTGGGWLLALAGAIIGYALIAGLGLIWRHTRGHEGIGLGDAKLLAAGGAWTGVGMLPVILLFASGIGLLTMLFVSQNPQDSESRRAIAFGPALGLGAWIAWCADGFVFR